MNTGYLIHLACKRIHLIVKKSLFIVLRTGFLVHVHFNISVQCIKELQQLNTFCNFFSFIPKRKSTSLLKISFECLSKTEAIIDAALQQTNSKAF